MNSNSGICRPSGDSFLKERAMIQNRYKQPGSQRASHQPFYLNRICEKGKLLHIYPYQGKKEQEKQD
jgi:hypothetical protein